MIRSIVDLVSRTSDHLVRDLGVDVGLKSLAKKLDKEAQSTAAIKTAKEELRARTRAVKDAAKELEKLRLAFAHLQDVLAFTPEGWPELRTELERKLRGDTLTGIAAWLDEWFTAASYCRTEALERLESLALPAGTSVLVERCISARRGLEARDWHLARPLLEAGADGVAFGAHTIPHERVRTDLRLLLARLALEQRLFAEADSALEGAADGDRAPAVNALRARSLRLRGEDAAATQTLASAADVAPGDLDVATELIETARSLGQRDLALDTARSAVAAIPILIDVEAELGRLVGPPPAVLWTAVAERALGEEDFEAHSKAVERAAEAVEYGDHALAAIVAELRARGAAAQRLPDEVCRALMDAGLWRVLAGQIDMAIGNYRRVLELRPNHDDASLRLADCLLVRASTQPLGEARPEIDEALELIRVVQRRGGINAQNSWSYLSEAVGLGRLGEADTPEARAHGWAAFEAVCRSIVHVPDGADRWRDLATTALALDLYSVCIAVSERAVELAPYDTASTAALVQSLTNIGRLDEAFERLGDDYDPWTRAVKAYILVRKGHAAEAAALLDAATLDPSWSWAYQVLVTALLMTDRYDDARSIADDVRLRWRRRTGESEAVWVEAWTSVVLDDLEAAERCADRLPPGRAQEIRAFARFLEGDADGGVAALREAIANAPTPAELDDVRSVFAGVLGALLGLRGVPQPDLGAVDADIASRRSELESRADPYAELASAPPPETDGEIATVPKAMGAALIQLARRSPVESLPELRALAARHPLDRELRALVQLAEDGEPALESPPPPLEPAEEAPVTEPGDQRLEMLLPTSWFEGHDDPINDHPLFLRYIPELRARVPWDVPGVHVRVDDELEPDRYRILLLGELVEEGHASPAHRYAWPSTLELLRHVAADGEPDERHGLVRIPASSIASGDGVAELLTLNATELVVQRLKEIAQVDAEFPGPVPSRRWSKRLVSALARGDRA